MFSSYYMDSRGHVSPNKVRQDDVPVVVISPEDREQVERLAVAYAEHGVTLNYARDRHLDGDRVESMQAALRSLIAPPKPDEPQGLGAVVEDAEGKRYVRHVMPMDNEGRTTWCDEIGIGRPWSDIDAVKILSEGVTS